MEPDTLFGKYFIRRQLGRGGMGVVYLAEDTTLMRLVAVKVLDRPVTSSPHFVQRFQQEARLIASLNHPNIVPVHALSQIGEDWALEMPYIAGGSLMHAEEQGLLDLRQLLGCIRDILLALAACHEAGIIHRDVKPSNILLNEQQRGMLSDFGLARLLSLHQQDALGASCSASLFFGTPRYAPPESWEEGEPTPAWDIYSTGMVLYEAIAGKTPYDAQTPLSLMKQMLERPVAPLKEIMPHVSEELSSLVHAMLARDPAERPVDMDAVLERFWALPELHGDSASPPVLVRDTGPPRPRFRKRLLPRPHLSGRGVAVASGVVLVALLLFTAGYALYGREMSNPASLAVAAQAAPGLAAFDTVNMQTQEAISGYCMGELTGDGRPWRLFAAGPTHVWLLDVVERPDERVDVTGHWADYDRAAAMRFRHGTVTGRGRWVHSNRDLSVAFSFADADGMDAWEEAALFRRTETPASGPAFLCTLASSNALSSLVHNELLPRNLSWSRDVSHFFQRLGLQHVSVPFHASGGEAFTLDGRLLDSVWRISLGDVPAGFGQTAPVAGPENSFMRIWRDSEAIHIGLHVATPIAEPRFMLALQTMHAVPSAHSERWIVQAENDEIIAAKRHQGGVVAPWNCAWEIRSQSGNEAVEAEIRIPTAGLNMAAAPMTAQRWLLNCQVGSVRPGSTEIIARWGSEMVEKTPCGMLLSFEP